MTDIVKRILEVKNHQGINDRQLEIKANLKPASVQSWKNGRRNSKGELIDINPSIDSIIKIAKTLNVATDYLLCLTDEPKPLLNEANNLIATQDTTLSTQFAKDYEQLLKDKNFIDTAKLYNEIPSEYRALCFGVILGALQSRGIDTNKILGIK